MSTSTAKLVVIQGPDKGRTIEVNDPGGLIGRGNGEVPINDNTVSRRHAEIRFDNGAWTLRDLESANGTYVNGARLNRGLALKQGDQIRMGSTLLLFGHALSEKLVDPYKSITAHVLKLPIPLDLRVDALTASGAGPVVHPWDGWLAARLTPEWLATKPYTPLPVLGVPGWWAANEEPDFYADAQVFRPARVLVPQ